ncbi:hypothetical protein PHET_06683 [Paragonimus heterotremus]|uniref:Huntingtin n=1 Tax=Paragonimus heterotremus TaxID=100268 RepID=A0A8J4T6M3_9TREM|nr:hypothetical protein PHET_06683 [Paragonimus heterotremus]
MADFNLLASLKTLGAGHPTTDNTVIATNLDGDSSSGFSAGSSSSVLNASTTQPTRAELLRATHQLVDGLLRMQSKASSSAPGYLSAVLPCLFKLLNNPSQDVRIAADEGINKLIKLLRVSMTHQVILELFVELKRNQSSRTVAASLSKFASLVNRIRISKRRFYMTELLPVLITVCERTEEPIFEALSDHFATIASYLFHYATESELREFLRRQRIHLSSDTALIRRSIAQLLVSTCQYSRYPFPLLRLLLQDTVAELNSPDRPAISRCTGLFNTIRYLSIAWQQTLASNCNGLWMETKQTLTSVSRTRISPESSSRLTSTSARSSEGNCTDIAGFPSNSSTVADLPMDLSERDCQLWSLAFFTCLDYGTSCSISVSTAALEALLQLLTARHPMMLYPRQWLSRSMHWVLRQTEPLLFEGPPVDATSRALEPDDPIELQRFGRIMRNESTNTLSSSAALSTRLHDANPPSTRMFGLTGETDDRLEHRSVSSLSLASSLDADPELSSAHQLVCQQLSAVKARLARTEPQAGHQRSQSDEDYSVDLFVANSSYTSSDPSVIVLNLTPSESAGGEARTNHSSTRLEHCPVRLLTLTELLSYMAPKDPVSLLATDWLISYLSVQFGLINNSSSDLPRPIVQLRTSSQLLAIACLIQLVQMHPIRFVDRLPLDLCCSSDVAPLKGDCPTGVDLIIDLLTTSTDPQVRGQLCLLIGQLIAAYLVQQRLLELHDVTDRSMRRLFTCLDSLLSSEVSGTTYRLALAGLRSCANAVLGCAPTESSVPNGTTNLLIDLLNCIARQFTPAARHSYRLVRLEFLHLVRELDWITLNYLESCKLSRPVCAPLTYLTRPTRLFDLAWIETWRLLSDSESDVRDLASVTLTGSLMVVLPTVSDDLLPTFVQRSLERRLQFWYPCEFSIFHLPIMSYGLLDCWNAQSVPPCLSGLPVELDVGPAGLLDLPASAWLLYAESVKKIPCSSTERCRQLSRGVHVPGSSRLFRECVAGLLELPCASLIPDDRYMIHGIVRCLNRLLGQTHILAFTDIWYEAVPSSQIQEDSAIDGRSCLERQHRPRIALLSWQCLTLLSATALTTCDLDLHIDLLQLCTGCLTRWALCSLTEGSIPTGIRSMSLDLRHSYTRFALSLLHHVARVLFVLWHVVEDLQPSLVPPSGAHADPFNPDPSLSLLHSIAQISQSDELPTTSSVTKTNANSVPSRKLAPGEAQRRPMSARLGSPLKKAQSDSPSSETRRILGYFSHLPHYMALYQTLRTAFQTYKISLNSSCSQDRLMHFLQTYLHTLGRLMGNLRLAETAPYSDELLTYVAVLYHWHPGACLEASTQILRAFVGTNLVSHWDSQLTELYNLALGAKPWPPSQVCTKETALGSCSPAPNEKTMTDLSERSHNPLDKLFDQHTQRTHILLSPTHSVSVIASWLGLDQLSRTPITAWIRFARQWRIPLPLTSKASSIKVSNVAF